MRAHTKKRGTPAIYFKKNIYPGNDFYKYVNGNWLETAHLPSTAHSTGISHTMQKKYDACIIHNAKKLMKSASGMKGNGFLSYEQKKQVREILIKTHQSVHNFTHLCKRNQIAILRLFSQINSIETK